jgi:hypothetical protein
MLIGTSTGLFRLKTLFSKPLDSYDITAYPQPFDPNRDDNLKITGLAADSEIRIVSPAGELVHIIRAQGKEILWDGRDKNGNFVNSGVYLLLAGSEFNGESSVAKIAVVKK